jgi:hypothetical protein
LAHLGDRWNQLPVFEAFFMMLDILLKMVLMEAETLGMMAPSARANARYPFWSPDSKSVGFFAANIMKRVDLAGGSPQTIC